MQLAAIHGAMFAVPIKTGEVVLAQGDEGDTCFVVESGSYQVKVAGKGLVRTISKGEHFG